MPMVRAMRLLNSIEAGTTNATQLQTLVSDDAGRLGDMRALFKLRGQCDRIKANPSAVTVLFGSSSVLAALQAVDTSATRIYTPSFTDSSIMVAVAASFSAMGGVIGNVTALAALIASSTAMTAATASSTAVALLSADSNANNLVFNGSYKVGAYLDKIAVDGGAASNSTLAAINTMSSVNASVAGMAAVTASTAAMNALAKSANARTMIGTNGNGYDAIKVSNMAIGKLVAGAAGLDPSAYGTMDEVAASSTARTAIGTSGAAYDVVKLSDVAIAKYLAGIAGQTPSSFANLSALVASSTAMTAIAGSAAAMAALVGSSVAIGAVVASSTAMTALFGNATAKMAIFNSDTMLTAIAGSTAAMAAGRAASGYSIQTATENGTNTVALSWPGANYIVLGCSHSGTNSRNVTLNTLRTGSAIANTGLVNPTASTAAQDSNIAVPVNASYSFSLSGTGSVTIYFGALRCDV